LLPLEFGALLTQLKRLEQEARIGYAQADHLIETWPLKPVLILARDRIELPARGFPFLVPKHTKHLKYFEKPLDGVQYFPGIRPVSQLKGRETAR